MMINIKDDFYKGKRLAIRTVKRFLKYYLPFAGSPITFVEIGVWNGLATDWVLKHVMTHPQSKYIGIDPYDYDSLDPWMKRRFTKEEAKYIEFKMFDKIDNLNHSLICSKSEKILPTMADNSIHCAYIDGAHIEANVMLDSIHIWRMLRPGGVVIWDNYAIRGRFHGVMVAADMFLETIPNQFKLLFTHRQLGIRKL